MKSVSLVVGGMLTLLLMGYEVTQAQCTPPARRTWIVFSDVGTCRDTVWFGHHPNATPGLDVSLCEMEFPPLAPAGICEVRFVNPPGRTGTETPAGMGQGFKSDYRPYNTTAQIDTYRVHFQPNDPPGYPVTLTWSPAGITSLCDSAWIQDELGGAEVRVRMHVLSSLVVSNPPLASLVIVKFGAQLTNVEQVSDELPGNFALSQNYPNPFNPVTHIEFAVMIAADIDVSVYDILGRKVATLVSQGLAPGTYRAVWDGADISGGHVASGIYFVRMTADGGDGAQFMATHKVMLLR